MLDKAQMGGLTAAEYLAALDTPELANTTPVDVNAATGTVVASQSIAGLSTTVFYVVTCAISNYVSGQVRLEFKSGVFTNYFSSSQTFILVAGVSGAVQFRTLGATELTVAISVQELPGYHATAPSDAARPILRDVSSTYALDFDNVDDAMSWTTPAITDGTWVALTRNGSYAASAAYSAGTYTMPIYQPFDLCAILWTSADLTTVQEAIVLAEGSARGAAADFGGVTSFIQGWRNRTDLRDFPVIDTGNGTNFLAAWFGCSGLTSFPLLDVSSGTNFSNAWRSCAGLTSFPLLDVSSGTDFSNAWQTCTSLASFPALDVSSGTNFGYAWQSCISLTTFPANMFDSVTTTNFANAFASTNLTQTSIDNILTSINTAGTSSGTFLQSGGSAPSATGEAAIDALRARGWTVTVTGGY
jgi:hypothetical protein